ncbi:hypothetical protein FRC18_002454, partial [Serendipita sp. 400]
SWSHNRSTRSLDQKCPVPQFRPALSHQKKVPAEWSSEAVCAVPASVEAITLAFIAYRFSGRLLFGGAIKAATRTRMTRRVNGSLGHGSGTYAYLTTIFLRGASIVEMPHWLDNDPTIPPNRGKRAFESFRSASLP